MKTMPICPVPANSLGGSVNTVSKRAFERVKPLFVYRLYAGARQGDLSLSRRPAPLREAAGLNPGTLRIPREIIDPNP